MLKRVFAAVGIILASIPVLFSVFMLWFEYFRCGPTFYAKGYSEAKFLQLRPGMTPAEVEAMIGAPLDNLTREDGSVLWGYSNREDCTCDYQLRNVIFREGKVTVVDSLYWEE